MDSRLRLVVQKNYDDVCEFVARYIKMKIQEHLSNHDNNFVLGLPTGGTPLGVYKRLIDYYKRGELSFRRVTTFNMDEYYGISADDPRSYAYYMNENFFKHVDIDMNNVHLLDGSNPDEDAVVQRYEEAINENPINLWLGGVGINGHIAFNEPGSNLESRTRKVTLTNDTREQNAEYFGGKENVPTHAYTVGLKTILGAREIVIIASGESKAAATSMLYSNAGIDNNQIPPINLLGRMANRLENQITYICDEECCERLPYGVVQNALCDDATISGKAIPWDIKLIKPNDKVLIVSPHPDDDVIGMGGTMALLANYLPIENIAIVYMTDGLGGLNKHENYPLRIKEALSALLCLGYTDSNVFCDVMPFYRRDDRQVTSEDYGEFVKILQKIRPNHIFVCTDVDPKRTHVKCMQIVANALKEFATANIPEYVWRYTGAWKSFKNIDINKMIRVRIGSWEYERKILSIRMHMSQHPPIIGGDDPRDFLQRAIDNDIDEDLLYDKIERFYVTSPESFCADVFAYISN